MKDLDKQLTKKQNDLNTSLFNRFVYIVFSINCVKQSSIIIFIQVHPIVVSHLSEKTIFGIVKMYQYLPLANDFKSRAS